MQSKSPTYSTAPSRAVSGVHLFIACTVAIAAVGSGAVPVRGDLVRLTRGETLEAGNEAIAGGAKGQEFVVLQSDPRNGSVSVPFFKDDGTLLAATLPAAALEAVQLTGWLHVLRGTEAFRDGRYPAVKGSLAAASQDAQWRAIAAAIAPRLDAATAAASAKPALSTAIAGLRELCEGLVKLGHQSLALAIDEGADRLGAPLLGAALPPAKADRAELTKRVGISNRALARARQAMALRRTSTVAKLVEEGLAAEPGRPELIAMRTRIASDVKEADERFTAADGMRRHGEKGVLHALTAIEMGLKHCADHPKLLALRREMQSTYEDRTAPAVSPALLKLAGAGASPDVLEEGRRLYTTRCTNCHDLELLDSRTRTSWEGAVASMARRARLDGAQQARIMQYIAAAQSSVAAD